MDKQQQTAITFSASAENMERVAPAAHKTMLSNDPFCAGGPIRCLPPSLKLLGTNRLWRGRLHSMKGASMLEFALTLPLTFFVFLFFLDLILFLWATNFTDFAVNTGAKKASITPYMDLDLQTDCNAKYDNSLKLCDLIIDDESMTQTCQAKAKTRLDNCNAPMPMDCAMFD